MVFLYSAVFAASLATATCPEPTLSGIKDESQRPEIIKQATEACKEHYGSDACPLLIQQRPDGRFELMCGPGGQ